MRMKPHTHGTELPFLGFWDADIAYEIQFDGIGVLWNQHSLDGWIAYETENGGMEF